MRRRTQQYRLDQVMAQVYIEPGLLEVIQRGPCGTTRDKPGFLSLYGRIGKLAALPYQIAVAANQVRPGITVGLGVNEQYLLAHFSLECIVSRQSTHCAIEDDMGRDESLGQFEHFMHAFGR